MDVSKCVCHTKKPKTVEAQEKKTKQNQQKNIYKVCVCPTSLGGLVFPFLTDSPSNSASKLSIWDSNSPTYLGTEYITKLFTE